MPTIYLAVTTDLSFDQRMIRICGSLAKAGYEVILVGRRKSNSAPLLPTPYYQKRLNCFFEKGKLFYAEYNTRLFFYLLFKRMDAICAVDLDTILPCYYISKLKKIKNIFDAHEYFSEQKEIVTRPRIYRIWRWIEKKYMPRFKSGYTVSLSIANAFREKYAVSYEVIRNLPLPKPDNSGTATGKKIILYQGAINEARGLEYLIPAMRHIDAKLHLYGDGNFVMQANEIIRLNNLQEKVFIKNQLLPEELDNITQQAYIGINLVENTGFNQYYSLANKFFDYIQHGIPQVSMNYPEYSRINEQYHIALLIGELNVPVVEKAITRLLTDEKLYTELKNNCLKAKKELNWQEEEKKLLTFYRNIFG